MMLFKKMHSSGEDFVVFDARMSNIVLSVEQIQRICHRKEGIGADKLIILKISEGFQETAFIHIYNADGIQAPVNGNDVRCVADLLMTEEVTKTVVIETMSGMRNCHRTEEGLVTSDLAEDTAEKVSYVFEGKLLDIV